MEHKNFGLIIEPVKPSDFVLGTEQSIGAKYGADAFINSKQDWTPYTPPTEQQDTNDGDTWACASYGTLHATQMLARIRFQDSDNLSDRFLAKTSGTIPGRGNSPQKVADTLRHSWTVLEAEWPHVDTVEAFYAEIPDSLKTLAVARGAEFEFGYQIVPNNPASIKSALYTSPVCIAVTAWEEQNGVYVRIPGIQENHWTCIIKVLDNGNYLVFDSFAPFIKEVNPEACKSIAMSYYLNENVVVESAWEKFINAILKFLTGGQPESVSEAPLQVTPIPMPAPTPAPVPTTPPAHASKLDAFCEAIKQHEGWFPGSTSFRNNNPGNCRYSSQGYLDVYLPVLKDPQNFAVFKDYATGWLYLHNLIREKIQAQPQWTILQFFENYAPAADNNDPIAYAAAVGKQLGEDYKTFVISNLL